jgi:hypothetical protein
MTDYVQVPVSVDRLQEVFALLAQGVNQTPETALQRKSWDEPSLRLMWDDSQPSVQDLLMYMATNPSHSATNDDVVREAKLAGQASVPGAIGALAKRCYNRYGRDLPWVNDWTPSSGSLYVMAPEVAATIASFSPK